MKPLVLVVGARGIPNVEGGAEKNAEKLFPLVAQAGYRVVLMGLADKINGTEYKGVELVRAPRSRLLGTDKLAYYLWALGRARRLTPDIVHLQGLGSALFLFAYKMMGAKVVVRYGSADYVVSKWGLLGKLGFLLSEYQLRFADAVIAVTPALAERLERRGVRGNVHVIANACDTVETPASSPAGAPYALVVGRVTAQKNLVALVKGYKAYRKHAKDPCRLLLVGGLDDAKYVKRLRAIAPEGVELVGRVPRDELGPYYAGARFYINSSIHEGCSNAVLEAISYAAPVVISDIPENRDFGLKDPHYFSATDTRDIEDMFTRVNANPETYRVTREQFPTWAIIAAKTLEIYARVRGATPVPERLECADA